MFTALVNTFKTALEEQFAKVRNRDDKCSGADYIRFSMFIVDVTSRDCQGGQCHLWASDKGLAKLGLVCWGQLQCSLLHITLLSGVNLVVFVNECVAPPFEVIQNLVWQLQKGTLCWCSCIVVSYTV